MEAYIALGFQNHEDFEICNKRMKIESENAAVSEDGMFTVLVKKGSIMIPHGTLVVTTNKEK